MQRGKGWTPKTANEKSEQQWWWAASYPQPLPSRVLCTEWLCLLMLRLGLLYMVRPSYSTWGDKGSAMVHVTPARAVLTAVRIPYIYAHTRFTVQCTNRLIFDRQRRNTNKDRLPRHRRLIQR